MCSILQQGAAKLTVHKTASKKSVHETQARRKLKYISRLGELVRGWSFPPHMGRINFSISFITSLHLIIFLRNSRHICTNCEKLILYANFLPLFDFGRLILALFVTSYEKLYITIREYISCRILSDFLE